MVPIRIIMADDHEIFREGFAAMFRNHPEIELVDQASNGKFLIAQVEQHRPDIVITDIQMDGMDGIEATRIICQRFPSIAVIAMSMYDDNYTIMEMLKAGAVGYLVKNASKETVIAAIRSAFSGEHYYCRTSSQKLSALISAGRFDPNNPELVDFTPTELRIIRLICDGVDSKEIAEQLYIGKKVVEKYRMEIWEKAGVKSTAGLILFAIRNGMYRV